MTAVELYKLLKKRIALVVAASLVGCVIGAGAGCALLTGSYTSSTSIYVGLSQDIPVMSEDGSVVENYRQYQSDSTTNMVTDVATIAQNKQVIAAAAEAANIANPSAFAVTSDIEPASHVITLTVTGPDEDVQKLANQLPLVLQGRAENILLLDNIQQIDKASDPSLSSTTTRHVVYCLVGLVCGLFIAILICVLQDMLRPRIKNACEMESNFGIPVLGDISDAAAVGRLRTVLAERSRDQGGAPVGIASISGQDAPVVVPLLNASKDDDEIMFAELPALMDSAESISKAVGAKSVALVVRLYTTLDSDIETAIDQLRLARVTILGFIVID